MSQKRPYRWSDQFIVAGIFAALGLAALAFFVLFAEPPMREHRAPFKANYDEAPLTNALAGDGLDQRIAAIARAGAPEGARELGRLSGGPGCSNTEALVLDAFRQAGLTIRTQEFRVVVPATEYCEVLDETGTPLPGVKLYPFSPSGLSPVAVPPGGVDGELVVMESTDLRYLMGHDPEKSIVLTYVDSAGGWQGLAALGVKAVIVVEDEAARKLRSSEDERGSWDSLVSQYETAYPRFLARGPLASYAGKRLTIRSKVVWQERKVRNLVGALKGAGSPEEALVLTTFYDSNSLVPEIAPGGEQAVSLAMFLEYVRALAPYRGSLVRDVVFVATAGHGQGLAGSARLMEAVEDATHGNSNYRPWEALKKEEEARLHDALHGLELLRTPELWTGEAKADLRGRWQREEPSFRAWFEKRLMTVAGDINLEHKDLMLDRRLAYLRAGSPVFRDGFDVAKATERDRKDPANSHPLLRAYLAAQELDNKSGNMMGLPLWQLVARPEFESWNYRGRAEKHFEDIAEYHQQQIKEIEDTIGIRDLFKPYTRTFTINLELNSGGSRAYNDLSLQTGIPNVGSMVEPQVTELARAILDKTPEKAGGGPALKVIHWGAKDAEGLKERPNIHSSYQVRMESEPWVLFGRLGFSILNYQFQPAKIGTPEDTFEGLKLGVVKEQLPIVGRAILSVAQGRIPFKTITPDRRKRVVTLSGAVYGNAGTGSVVPKHPMTRNTFVRAVVKDWQFDGGQTTIDTQSRGIRVFPVLKTNPYGEYYWKFAFNYLSYGGWGQDMVGDAACFGDHGEIRYFKDASPGMQSVFKNEKFPTSNTLALGGQGAKPLLISVFRCSRVELFERGNPKTMKSFRSVDYLTRLGLSSPRSFRIDPITACLEPDTIFYLGLMDGAADNKEILVYRAFMLNADPAEPISAQEPEIYGKGYLAADVPNITYAHMDAAESMLRTDEKRLGLQRKYGMADEQMMDFHKRGREWLEQAKKSRADKDVVGAVMAAGKSLAYSINNHPVIRTKISHAVIGILWYLGLLVPFVFFFEKLVFGFTDIRKQLLADGAIFLVVFSLLRVFHPAFQMVRSSMVILIGFLILLLTLLVTFMVGGKFKQNIKDLRSKEGRIEGADINRGGVIGTAFMLGLNNMRRRKVRTGLTSITLVLITFVMICFTSVSTDLVNLEYPIGHSPWNGVQIQNENYVALTDAEIANLRQIYGLRYPVAVRSWLTAVMWADRLQNAEIIIDREYEVGGQKIQKRAKVSSSLQMEWSEPMFSGIDRFLVSKRQWFPQPPATRKERIEALERGYKGKYYVVVPDTAARDLEITPEAVNAGGVKVSIRGDEYEVLGIIDSAALTEHIGLDGRSILPYDLNSVQTLGRNSAGAWIVPEDVRRLPASQVIIVNRHPTLKAGYEQAVSVSCGILFPQHEYQLLSDGAAFPPVGFKEQRRLVLEYLERVGQPAYYAVDGIAYYGSRMRAKTFEGLLDLLIPILIAALTVFNTMRGSVYERRDEIYVYNAVGIAPNHVFFMFMAEACVYAVVGAMLGYLLSQATGRVLTALNMTGGMNMNYSSIETIYASLAIVAAVMLSTIIPARDAAKLASPSETKGWTVPEPVNDAMAFNLPFTFTSHDRIAVVSYFHRWLDSNGEGSSGPFFCAAPEPTVRKDAAEPRNGGLVPGVATTIWLKPYDLGVSQRLEIWLPTDHETKEYIANVRLVRLSGTAAAWDRTVKPFLSVLRKQFLNWRAATPAEREEMYAEARRLLTKAGVEEKQDA